MIIVMRFGAAQEQIDLVADTIRNRGFEPLVLPGQDRTAIGVPASLNNDQRMADLEALMGSMDGVSKIDPDQPSVQISLERNSTTKTRWSRSRASALAAEPSS